MVEFYMASEYAGQIVADMVEDLRRRFYEWVCKLAVGTDHWPYFAEIISKFNDRDSVPWFLDATGCVILKTSKQ